MIAYSIDELNGLIALDTSDGHSAVCETLDDALLFLLERDGQTGFRVFWDLDEAVAPLLKLLTEVQQRELFGYGKVNYMDFGLLYNYHKNLSIRHKGKQANYYHLCQYYPELEKPPLDKVQELGQQLLDELKKISVKPASLSSGIAIMDGRFDPLPLPTWEDTHEDVAEFAWQCAHRAWTEAHQIGRWETAYDYDIISAYPSVLGDLWDFRYGTWVNQKEQPKDVMYGFVYGEVSITANVSPAIFISADGHGYSVGGKWTDYMTLDKLECIRRHNIGDMVIKDAWWWMPTKKVQPLLITVGWLYKQRQVSPLLNRLIKLGMNGLYGRMLQVFPNGDFGKRFNPVWGALCEERTAVKVTDFIYEQGLVENVIHIATDGVLVERPAGLVPNKGLGEWKEDSKGPAIVVDSSTVFYGNKRPNSLTYEQAKEMIETDPTAGDWHRKIRRRMTLGDVLQGTAEGLGDYKEVETGFRLKTAKEHDRFYKRLPSTGAELLGGTFQSKPLRARSLKSGMELDTTQYEE